MIVRDATAADAEALGAILVPKVRSRRSLRDDP
jgi:hypothetical protein